MKILVTGGAGFIGSCFVRHMLNKHQDYKIINIDALTYAGNIANLDDVKKKFNDFILENQELENVKIVFIEQ